MSKTRDVVLVGGTAALLWLLLRGGGSGTASAGQLDVLTRCNVFVQADGTLRLNGQPSSLDEIKRRCGDRVLLRASGAARFGDLERVRSELEAEGLSVAVMP